MEMNSYGSQGNTLATQLHSFRAVTVKQILDAQAAVSNGHPDDPVKIDGEPADRVFVVGILRDVTARQGGTAVDLRIEDVSGTLDTLQFVSRPDTAPDFGEGTSVAEQFAERSKLGAYAICYGKFSGNRKRFTVQRVDQEVGAYQVLYHEVQALREHLAITGEIPFGSDNSHRGASAGGDVLFVDSNGTSGDIKGRVAAIIRTHDDNDDGVTTEYISRELGVDQSEVRRVINSLIDEGTAYAADDNLYRWSG